MQFSPIKPIAGNVVRNSPIRMKPKPIGFEFDEIEARQILRPFSHDKYIHEPDYDSVVYINRYLPKCCQNLCLTGGQSKSKIHNYSRV